MTDQKRYEEVRGRIKLTDEEINRVFGQDMSAIGDWITDCRAVAEAQLQKALNDPHLFIEGEERLPNFPHPTKKQQSRAYCGQWIDSDWFYAGQSQAQQDMLKANYKRAIDIKEVQDEH